MPGRTGTAAAYQTPRRRPRVRTPRGPRRSSDREGVTCDLNTSVCHELADRLVDTHIGWRQHCQQHLIGDIVLAELSNDEAAEYVRERGISVLQRLRGSCKTRR